MTIDLMWSETDYCTPPKPLNPTLPLSDGNSYRDGVFSRNGAAKLASSFIGPLVAAAAGYTSLTRGRADQALADIFGGYDARTKEVRAMKQAISTGDLLVMPWWSIDQLSDDLDYLSKPRSMQFRPDCPLPDPTKPGKFRKYTQAYGSDTILEIHPSIPHQWLRDSGGVAILEGLLKCHAFLTAQLLHHGIDPQELAWPEGGSVKDARQKLRDLLDQVHPDEAILPIGIVGVSNWHKAPEWSSIRLRNRKAYVAFDGDGASNHNVWREMKQMREQLVNKDAQSVEFIDLSSQVDECGEKCGIDDVLANGLTFVDVMALATEALPPEPARAVEECVGEWRINPDARVLEECVQEKNAYGEPQQPHWETRASIIGRVTMIETSREPNHEEMKTGVFSPRDDGVVSSKAEFRLYWYDENTGDPREATVVGPDHLLEVTPKEWHKQQGVMIPAAVKRVPHWPMTKCGDRWLEEVKRFRSAETDERSSWARMGWVPVRDGAPVFIVGDQVVGPDGDVAKNGLARPGVTEAVLTGASSFGVQFPKGFAEMSEADRKRVIREDILKVKHAYLENGAWTDPGVAAAVLAAMIRPTVPLRTKTSIYIVGPRGGGKSFTASFILSGWQPEAGIWSENKLSGAAKDTMAATEHAVARTPIWVVDDLAPSTDPNQARLETAKLADLIRSIHNGTSKRRMTRDLESRHVLDPHALLVITAENEHPVSSVRDRVITLTIRKGSLGPTSENTDPLVDLRDQDGAAARVVGYMLSHFAAQAAQPDGWKGVRLRYETEVSDRTSSIKNRLVAQHGDQGAASRHAALVADLGLGLTALGELGEWAGIRGFRMEIVKHLLPLADMVSGNHANRAESSPGAALIDTSRLCLADKKTAHVVHYETAGVPFESRTDPVAIRMNAMLGWHLNASGEYVSAGERVGQYFPKGTFDDYDEPFVILEKNVMDCAQRKDPQAVPPGTQWGQSSIAANDEGLGCPFWKGKSLRFEKTTSGIAPTKRKVRTSGIPVPLKVITLGSLAFIEDQKSGDA